MSKKSMLPIPLEHFLPDGRYVFTHDQTVPSSKVGGRQVLFKQGDEVDIFTWKNTDQGIIRTSAPTHTLMYDKTKTHMNKLLGIVAYVIDEDLALLLKLCTSFKYSIYAKDTGLLP